MDTYDIQLKTIADNYLSTQNKMPSTQRWQTTILKIMFYVKEIIFAPLSFEKSDARFPMDSCADR